MKSVLKAPGPTLLKLRYDGPLLNFAFKFNLRHYTVVLRRTSAAELFGGGGAGAGAGAGAGVTVRQTVVTIPVTYTQNAQYHRVLQCANTAAERCAASAAAGAGATSASGTGSASDTAAASELSEVFAELQVGRCRLTGSKSVLRAPMVPALESIIS
jgi:hypothetical protein